MLREMLRHGRLDAARKLRHRQRCEQVFRDHLGVGHTDKRCERQTPRAGPRERRFAIQAFPTRELKRLLRPPHLRLSNRDPFASF